MDKTIRRFLMITITILMTGTPVMAYDYEKCAKLQEAFRDAFFKGIQASVESSSKIIVPESACALEPKEKISECIYNLQVVYQANTQKPKGKRMRDNAALYTAEGVYWDKVQNHIMYSMNQNKCPQ
jgi:hypothetical protein